MSRRTILFAFGLSLAASLAGAGTSLPDRTTLAVTTEGLFVLPASAAGGTNTDALAFRVAAPVSFGYSGAGNDALPSPSVTWVDHTDFLFVATNANVAGPGRLFRVRVDAAGQVLSIAPLATGAFADVEYAAGLDTLFVLDAAGGRVFALFDPVHASGSDVTVWNDKLAPAAAKDLSLDTNTWPFALTVLTSSGFFRVAEGNGAPKLLYANPGFWDKVERHPVHNDFVVLSQGAATFGFAVVNLTNGAVQGTLEANACGPPPSCSPFGAPLDVVTDGRPYASGINGLIVVSKGVPKCCLAGATGPNHVARFPVAWKLPPNDQTTLLTPTPVSGIGGGKPDIDFVRRHARGLTHQGAPATTADGAHRPELAAGLVDRLDADLEGAPPHQLAVLAIHVVWPGHPVPVSALDPLAAPVHAFRVTDGAGAVPYAIDLPSMPGLDGARGVLQWYVRDPSAGPADPPFAWTQRLVYHHGTP